MSQSWHGWGWEGAWDPPGPAPGSPWPQGWSLPSPFPSLPPAPDPRLPAFQEGRWELWKRKGKRWALGSAALPRESPAWRRAAPPGILPRKVKPFPLSRGMSHWERSSFYTGSNPAAGAVPGEGRGSRSVSAGKGPQIPEDSKEFQCQGLPKRPCLGLGSLGSWFPMGAAPAPIHGQG